MRDLERGTYSYNNPSEVQLGDSFPLALILETNSAQQAAAQIERLPGPTVSREAPFARSLVARIIEDSDLEVWPKEPQRRIATSAAPVRWDWSIKPKSAGEKALRIVVDAELLIPSGPPQTVQVRVFAPLVNVKVTPFQWMADFLTSFQGIAASLGAIAAAFLGVRQLLKRGGDAGNDAVEGA